MSDKLKDLAEKEGEALTAVEQGLATLVTHFEAAIAQFRDKRPELTDADVAPLVDHVNRLTAMKEAIAKADPGAPLADASVPGAIVSPAPTPLSNPNDATSAPADKDPVSDQTGTTAAGAAATDPAVAARLNAGPEDALRTGVDGAAPQVSPNDTPLPTSPNESPLGASRNPMNPAGPGEADEAVGASS